MSDDKKKDNCDKCLIDKLIVNEWSKRFNDNPT